MAVKIRPLSLRFMGEVLVMDVFKFKEKMNYFFNKTIFSKLQVSIINNK